MKPLLFALLLFSQAQSQAHADRYPEILQTLTLANGETRILISLRQEHHNGLNQMDIYLIAPEAGKTVQVGKTDATLESTSIKLSNGSSYIGLVTDNDVSIVDADRMVVANDLALNPSGSIHLFEGAAGELEAIIAGYEVVDVFTPSTGKLRQLIQRQQPSQYPTLVQLSTGEQLLLLEKDQAQVLYSVTDLLLGKLNIRYTIAANEAILTLGKMPIVETMTTGDHATSIRLRELETGIARGGIELDFIFPSLEYSIDTNNHIFAQITTLLNPDRFVSPTIKVYADMTLGKILSREIIPAR